MNKLVYASIVKDYVESRGVSASIIENARNNAGAIGISIKRDTNISPIFYISEDEDPIDFAKRILEFEPEEINIDRLSDIMLCKTEVLSRAHYILVNTALNESRTGIVRVPINSSLELHYKIDISDIMPDAKVSLEKKHLENLDIPLAELAGKAYKNTMRDYPAKIYTIGEALKMDDIFSDEFLVLSNESNMYGAGAILYEGMYKTLKDRLGGDFVVIPSSVHEMIIIKTEYGDISALTSIINDVNYGVVSDEEVLSDRPYKLIRDKKLVEA